MLPNKENGSPSGAAGNSGGGGGGGDDEMDPSKLSVADKVSLFKKSVLADPSKMTPSVRARLTRLSAAERRLRSQTQPVTVEEVQQAAREVKESTEKSSVEDEDAKQDSLSKMSLKDKLNMFNQKLTADVLLQKPPVRLDSTRRSLRLKPAEGQAAPKVSLGVPLARTRSHSSPPEDPSQESSAPKGILKSQPGQQPVVKGILKQDHLEHKEDIRGILKSDQPVSDPVTSPIKPILKPENAGSDRAPSSSESSEEEEEEVEEDVEEEEEDSSSSSSEEDSDEDEGDDKKKILLGGQRHLVIAQDTSAPASRKVISNPAIQRRLNASLRRKEEEERFSVSGLTTTPDVVVTDSLETSPYPRDPLQPIEREVAFATRVDCKFEVF